MCDLKRSSSVGALGSTESLLTGVKAVGPYSSYIEYIIEAIEEHFHDRSEFGESRAACPHR